MTDRSKEWLRQAERDLEMASESLDRRYYEWACFASQQSAEKAVKALHLHFGQEVWGHVVAQLLRELPVQVDEELIDKAHVLDAFYIGARYPNGYVSGTPAEHIGKLQAEQAVSYAGEILKFVRAEMARA